MILLQSQWQRSLQGGKRKIFQNLNRGKYFERYLTTNGHFKDEGEKNQSRKPKRSHVIGGTIAALFTTGLIVDSDFRQGTIDSFLIAERASVVTLAIIKCFGLYLWTLNKNYANEEEYQKALSKTHKSAAEMTLWALKKNGGVNIKLGQHVAAMTYLLPVEWTETMICLQSECPRSSVKELKEMFENDTGYKFDEYFSEFDEEPIGVASLAQVHRAKLANGEEVAIKMQHPSLAKFVPLDVALTKMSFDMMYKVFPEYSLTWLGDEMQESIFIELDFRYEAKNAKKTSNYFKNYKRLTALRVPEVYTAMPRVLVMEYISGARLDNLKYIDNNGINRAEVCACLAHLFNNMIFKSGFVHCDPHHGNIAIRALDSPKNGHNFEIILYDHGLYRTIPNQMKIDYSKFWLALIDKDREGMKKYGTKFAKINDGQFPIFAAAITGRDFEHATNGDIENARSANEIERMKDAMQNDGLFFDLMDLLATVPRIVLLILKTNDLVRHLDECLQSPLGQERTFLIMARYCTYSVFEDDITHRGLINKIKAYVRYYQRNSQLWLYDFVFYLNNLFKRII
ncbi:Cqd2 protein [Martiniozyma asiatica (nom. inval.)]|nr:Cqd2 protein [Martiniozyma asiatica]